METNKKYIFKKREHSELCKTSKCVCDIITSYKRPDEDSYEIIGKMSTDSNKKIEFYSKHVKNCKNSRCICKSSKNNNKEIVNGENKTKPKKVVKHVNFLGEIVLKNKKVEYNFYPEHVMNCENRGCNCKKYDFMYTYKNKNHTEFCDKVKCLCTYLRSKTIPDKKIYEVTNVDILNKK